MPHYLAQKVVFMSDYILIHKVMMAPEGCY